MEVIFLSEKPTPWIVRNYLKCTGCRRCEIACSLYNEGKIFPAASRVRVFMAIPGVEIPHLCAQCDDYPCVKSCPVDALSVNQETSAVIVDRGKCISCSKCITACPGNIPFLHPKDNKATICNLCNGDPECTKACTEAGFNALTTVRERMSYSRKLFALTPETITADVATNLYGEKAEEMI